MTADELRGAVLEALVDLDRDATAIEIVNRLQERDLLPAWAEGHAIGCDLRDLRELGLIFVTDEPHGRNHRRRWHATAAGAALVAASRSVAA